MDDIERYFSFMRNAGRIEGLYGDNGEFRGKDSLEEMKKLAEEDPAVKAGRMVVEIHPWYVQDGVLP